LQSVLKWSAFRFRAWFRLAVIYAEPGMLAAVRFWWVATRGHRLRPWRSDFLRWRLETYSGQKADSITAQDFFRFAWRERTQLSKFLLWTGQIDKIRKGKLAK